ncbi:MAG: hypothetical protein WBD55_01090 [Dehalococcoidia bacterium]
MTLKMVAHKNGNGKVRIVDRVNLDLEAIIRRYVGDAVREVLFTSTAHDFKTQADRDHIEEMLIDTTVEKLAELFGLEVAL